MVDMNESTVFSKIDLKIGYHQIELEEASRDITTFATHKGLYRYKRHMFGISAAPEIYLNIIQQTRSGCEGVINITDDILVHDRTVEEHDKRLEEVLKLLSARKLTVNREKCQF